ncbi:MAG: TonB-dependent receptor, partial [Proteobacteria bacterium]|nr:TonB-dependent receptor [Pseudomonadota bacterium]
ADRFVAGLDQASSIPTEARDLIRASWADCKDCDGSEFLTQGLAVLSPHFRQGLDAYDAEEYGDCAAVMRDLKSSRNGFIATHAAVYEIKALVAVFDAVISGELFEMVGGTAQFAAGAQYRDRSAKSRAPAINFPGVADAILSYNPDGSVNETFYITNNLECSNCIFNFDHDRDVSAVFLELSLPFAENVETQIAVRYEDYGGNIGSEVTPKFGISWRPIDELLVRASFSQSFRAPNIGVVEESFEAFGTAVQDPIRNQKVRAGLLPPTNENAQRNGSFTLGKPNPDLGTESADTFSAGFQWTPGGRLDGFSLGADIWRFEVEDRVLPQVPIAGLAPELELFKTAVADKSNYILNDSVKVDAFPQYESCDPDSLAAQFGLDSDERLECVVDPRTYKIEGVQRLLGSTSAQLVTIVLPAINGGNIVVDGIDLDMAYSWDSDWGRFRLSIGYTHVRQYEVSGIPGLDLGLKETGVTDAAGTDGDTPYVRSLPDNKGNITMSWSRDNHRITAINRYIGSYKVLDYDNRLETTSVRLLPYLKPQVPSSNTWDFQYNYTHSWSNDALGTTIFTAGLLDAFNEDLPMYRFQTYDRSVFDGRGRRWYARALWQF